MIIKYNVNTSFIKFDINFYRRHYPDLQKMSNNDLINHYIQHGKKEKRIFCNIPCEFNSTLYSNDKRLDSEYRNNKYKIWEHYLYNEYRIGYIKQCNTYSSDNSSITVLNISLEFNYNYYANKYSDLSKFNKIELYKHYHNHGRKEKRIFCNIIPQFNLAHYYLVNDDLNFDDIDGLWRHFIYHGIVEKRHCDYNTVIRFMQNYFTDNQKFVYTGVLPNNIKTEIIKINNSKLQSSKRSIINIGDNTSTINKSKIEFVNRKVSSINNRISRFRSNVSNGNNYKNIINNTSSISSTSSTSSTISSNQNKTTKLITRETHNVPKTAIIYVFYNRPGEQRNESNLAFFIRQTVLLDKTNIYLFIINGGTCEVIFPQQSNLFVIKNKNCLDIESYGIGINYLRQKLGQNLNGIERIVTMNCGITGPFYHDKHWLSEFEYKLSSTGSFVCSTIVYRLEKINNNVNSDIRTPGYFNYFINDTNIINQLLQKVYVHYNTKSDCIINGEYGFAKLLIQNNKTITSIINNYNKNLKHGWLVDRLNNLDKYDIYKLIFVKINWRSTNSEGRESIPVKFKNVISEMNNLSKFNNPIESCLTNINYNLLPIENKGNCYTNSYNWYSKQDFYNKFGKAEEFIIYPTFNNFSKLALYAHSDADNILKDYCITAINTLSLLGYEVIILTTCRTFINIKNLPYKIITISEAKTDLYMFQKYLNSFELSNKYTHLLLSNDTIVFPIHGINEMEKSIKNIINLCDYFGIWNSPETTEHLVGSFLHFSNKMFLSIKKYLNSYDLINCGLAGNLNDTQKCEINFVSYLNKQNFKYKSIVDYKTLNNINYQCPIMHPSVFPQWIHRKEVFAIKWKYMGNYINKNKINNPNLNYLLRYIHFNHTGQKGKPEIDGCYGNPVTYI